MKCERMRIGFNLYMSSTARMAGVQQSIRMCYYLAERGADVTLHLCTGVYTTEEQLFAFFGFEPLDTFRVRFYRNPFAQATLGPFDTSLTAPLVFIWGLLFHLRRAAALAVTREKDVYDVLWLRGGRFPALYIALKRFFPFLCIYEFHEIGYLNHVREQDLLLAEPRFDLPRWIYRKADGIVVISDTLRRLMQAKWGPRSQVVVIPSGATLFDSKPLAFRQPLRDIFFVGNYYYFSGLDVAIQALVRLPEARLTIVGGGGAGDPDFERIRALVLALNLEERVVFYGFVPPHQLPQLYAQADILVMPHTSAIRAKYFVSPLKLFQYMSANRPIVASDLPTVREILQDGTTALLVPPEDPAALASALEDVMHDTALASKIAANAYQESHKYSMEKRAEKMINFFTRCAAEVGESAFLEGKLLSGRVYPEFFRFRPNARVLNVGCGLGPQAVSYAKQYGSMVGVDINAERLAVAQQLLRDRGINNYATLVANVEQIPLPDAQFDHAIAIDIAEHVNDPGQLCREIHRLLKPNGELLITFPALHDFYTDQARAIGRIFFNKTPKAKPTGWDPDWHNQRMPLTEWITLVERCGFRLRAKRASTLFPPLHLYGMPRFWFKNETIHAIDSALCRAPLLQSVGQTLVCVFEKTTR